MFMFTQAQTKIGVFDIVITVRKLGIGILQYILILIINIMTKVVIL